MKKSMMDLVREAKELELSLEASQGEIDESMELALYQNKLDITTKADSCAFFYEHLVQEIKAWKSRVEETKAGLAKSERKLEGFSRYLAESLKGIGGKTSGEYASISTRPTSGQLKIIDKEAIPVNYKKEIITREWEIDNKAVKEDMALGVPVPGAELKINHSITIKQHVGGKK